MKIEKLIKEYRDKIACCDIDIKTMRSNRAEVRRKSAPWNHETVSYYSDISNEINQKSMLRQSYVQFTKDLGNL